MPPNSTNSTGTSCYLHENNNKEKNSGKTGNAIKHKLPPLIHQLVTQHPSNALIPMDTLQFCNLIGNKGLQRIYEQ